MYQESELSPWFDVSVQNPWAVGVYEVEIRDYKRDRYSAFAFFDGEKFCQPCVIGFGFVEESRTWANKAGHRVYKWRGLSYDPSLPKKLARHTDPATSKEAAEKVVKSGTHKNHCDKIRACLVEHGRMTPSEIAAKLKMRRSAVFRRMSDLKKQGVASRTDEKRGGQSVWNAI